MRSFKTKRFVARIADPTLFGPPASNNFLRLRVSPINPSAASPAEPKSARTASASILRVRDLLRDVLIREDVIEEILLRDEVRDGLDQVCRTLEHLAVIQGRFEFWDGMKA